MPDPAGDYRPPTLSAVVVNYNGGALLSESIDRLLRAVDGAGGDQTGTRAGSIEVEVIVADNGSTDGSLEPLKGRTRIHLLELGENLGFGAANNRAAAIAGGDRLLLINSDAWPTPGAIHALLSRLDADPRLGLVAPRLIYPDGRPQFHWAPTTSVLGEAAQMVRNRLERFPITHRLRPGAGWFTAACVLLRRRAFEDVGGFDEDYFLYFEDVDLCLRLRAAGWELGEAPDAVAVHIKGGSQPEGQSELHYRRGQVRYYRTHRPRWERLVLRAKLRRAFSRRTEPARSELLALLDELP
ncbi:MAG: glycosyltransferase family 2 protein [Acidobacteriota bacterium]